MGHTEIYPCIYTQLLFAALQFLTLLRLLRRTLLYQLNCRSLAPSLKQFMLEFNTNVLFMLDFCLCNAKVTVFLGSA